MTEDTIDDGGPAFPLAVHPERGTRSYLGMSLRDWFAGQSLVGMLANPNVVIKQECDFQILTKGCFLLADAMLKERLEKQ